jgi:hypothetical protein
VSGAAPAAAHVCSLPFLPSVTVSVIAPVFGPPTNGNAGAFARLFFVSGSMKTCFLQNHSSHSSASALQSSPHFLQPAR